MNTPNNKTIIALVKDYWFLIVASSAILIGAIELRSQVQVLQQRVERIEIEHTRVFKEGLDQLSDQVKYTNEKLTKVAEDVARMNGILSANE